MRTEGNHLDLNNLPEEYGKQAVEESSTTTAASTDTARFKKKKSAGKEDTKVYECRFCSLKFCKSQALGGHMNRHRQERETETLNRARQLVFSTDGVAGTHVGLRDMNIGGGAQAIRPGSFQHGGAISDQRLQFRPVYQRVPAQAAPPPLQPYIYPASSSSHSLPYPPPYPPHPSTHDYFIGHVLPGNSQRQPTNPNYSVDTNYTCYGAPLPPSFPAGARVPMTRDGAPSNQSEGVNWTSSYAHGHHADSSPMDRFRE